MSGADKKIAVIGGGSWATAIVKMLTNQNQVVNWWMHNESSATHILKYRHNPKYLQSVEFDLERINIKWFFLLLRGSFLN
jgi:glycerol-3-phosphate dehydrogenase (NAD(P)+)